VSDSLSVLGRLFFPHSNHDDKKKLVQCINDVVFTELFSIIVKKYIFSLKFTSLHFCFPAMICLAIFQALFNYSLLKTVHLIKYTKC